jgi:hypothetical protein
VLYLGSAAAAVAASTGVALAFFEPGLSQYYDKKNTSTICFIANKHPSTSNLLVLFFLVKSK